MRTWKGAVRDADAERYLAHQAETGMQEYRETAGNRGAVVLRRDRGDLVEVVTVSFWDSMDSVVAFAGEEPGQAKFYPGDDEFLVEKNLYVDHFEVVSSDLDL